MVQGTHSQTPQKLNVWAGNLGNHIVVPYYIDGNLSGQTDLELLDTTMNPTITQLFEDYDSLLEGQLTSPQDGALPHFVAPVRQFLDENFTGRWIGRRGPKEWPARSPDLTPVYFVLMGHLKSKIFITQLNYLHDLRRELTSVSRHLTKTKQNKQLFLVPSNLSNLY